jgi:hypothetical protein
MSLGPWTWPIDETLGGAWTGRSVYSNWFGAQLMGEQDAYASSNDRGTI